MSHSNFLSFILTILIIFSIPLTKAHAENFNGADPYCRSEFGGVPSYVPGSQVKGIDGRDPIFDNVDRVFIVLKVKPNLSNNFEKRIPDLLRAESIAMAAKAAYTKRYQRDGKMDSSDRNCYNRNNQQVIILSDAQKNEYAALLKKRNTLIAYVELLYSDKDNPLMGRKSDSITLAVVNYRSDLSDHIFRGIDVMASLSFDASNEILEKNLESFFKNSIH